MRYQTRYWWQILILMLWSVIACLFAYWIEGFERIQSSEIRTSAPDALSSAPDEVELWFLAKDIFIDGVHLNNFDLKHPLYLLEGDSGQLFFALDEEWKAVLGFESDVIRTEHIVLLCDTQGRDASLLDTGHLTCNLLDSSASVDRGYQIVLTNNIPAEARLTAKEKAKEEAEAARVALWLDTFPWLEELPWGLAEKLGYSRKRIERKQLHDSAALLRQSDGTVYLPFDWFTENEEFGWSVWTDGISGVYISTDPQIAAQDYRSEANAAYIDSLAQFMCSLNRRLTYAESLYFVYLFRHEGTLNDLDPIFLMALARNESTYRKHVIGGGAIGLMQIMPRTGEYFGYPTESLYDPHMNIEFGSSYIGKFIRTYGDVVIAMSAYNAGPGKVASGNYSTAYAEHVLGHQQTILGWLRSRGCSTSFDTGPLPAVQQEAQSGE